jgi:glycosyltransferase involved in cell wall biosynthesis
MRYCFFATGTYRGNPSLMRALCLGRELLARGVDVWYIADDVPQNREPGIFDSRARIAWVPSPGSTKQLLTRRKTIASVAPDFVHVIDPAPKAFLALVGSRWNIVVDYDEWPAGRPHRPLRKRWEKFLESWATRGAKHVIACSRFLQGEFQTRHHRDVAYIPYAVDPEVHSDPPSPFLAPTAVYMGTFSKPYDLDLLFHAARILAERGVKPPMCFVGKGPEWEMWSAFVSEHGLDNVQLTGWVDDAEMWCRLRNAHVLMFPIRPSIPNRSRCPFKTYLYAQAHRPVIVNRTGEIPEVLRDLATYVDCSPEAFAKAIDVAMKTPTLPDIDYGIERHNWGVRADQLLDLLA